MEYCEPSFLGEGGSGSVYLAKGKEDGRYVVLKLIDKSKPILWSVLEGNSVPSEIVYLQRVANVPNVVKLIKWYESEKEFTLVLEHFDPSMDLFAYLEEFGALTEDKARAFLKQIVNILLGCLEVGVMHLDVKDENILVTNYENKDDEPVLKLIDFGVAEFFAEDKQTYTTFEGTGIYYPPECTRGEYEGISATVYALGVLLYIMVCNEFDETIARKIPFEGKNVSEECQDLIRKCMQLDPSKRFPSLQSILAHSWFSATGSSKGIKAGSPP